MRYLSKLFLFSAFFAAIILTSVSLPAIAGDTSANEPIRKSADNRYWTFGNSTILDNSTGLLWMEKDYWQREGKWINWYSANEYAQRMNHRKFAGYSDWRLPTPEEALKIYDRRRRNTDKDGDKIYIDRSFPKGAGWSTWTNAEKSSKAVVVSFKDEGGKAYQDKISGVDAFLRLVRGPVS